MKNDKLKDFIQSHREDFDRIEKPNLDQIWKGVSLPKKEKKSNKFWLLGIVFLLIAMIAALAINFYQTNQKLNRLEEYVMHSPEYQNEHERLLRNVSEKELLIKKENINKEDFEEIFQELKELENNQLNIEADFQQYGNSDQLMKTLFKYYERKTKILEILLFENEKKKYDENINRHEI